MSEPVHGVAETEARATVIGVTEMVDGGHVHALGLALFDGLGNSQTSSNVTSPTRQRNQPPHTSTTLQTENSADVISNVTSPVTADD